MSNTFKIAGCSIEEVITCLFFSYINDHKTELLASVPLPVNIISLVEAWRALAITLLEDSISYFAFLPEVWMLEGFPK